jgi:hypothetical protein
MQRKQHTCPECIIKDAKINEQNRLIYRLRKALISLENMVLFDMPVQNIKIGIRLRRNGLDDQSQKKV